MLDTTWQDSSKDLAREERLTAALATAEAMRDLGTLASLRDMARQAARFINLDRAERGAELLATPDALLLLARDSQRPDSDYRGMTGHLLAALAQELGLTPTEEEREEARREVAEARASRN